MTAPERETLTALDVLDRFLQGRVDRPLYEDALTRLCPYCGAAPGWLCVTVSNRPTTDPHVGRMTVEARAAADVRREAERERARAVAARHCQERLAERERAWQKQEAREAERAWQEQEALLVPCPGPRCRAVIGAQCQQVGHYAIPHRSRMDRRRSVRGVGWDNVLALACPSCGVEAGAACVAPNGGERPEVHADRIGSRTPCTQVDARPDAVVLEFRAEVDR